MKHIPFSKSHNKFPLWQSDTIINIRVQNMVITRISKFSNIINEDDILFSDRGRNSNSYRRSFHFKSVQLTSRSRLRKCRDQKRLIDRSERIIPFKKFSK